MRRQARGSRVLRGAVAASLATFIALLSHVTSGGAVPGWIGVVVPLALSFVVCTALAGRRLSFVRLGVAVAVSQMLFHTLFVLGGYEVGAAGHVHGAAPILAAMPAGAVLTPDATMWGGHLVAAAITTLVLHRGERTVTSLGELAARSIAWVRVRASVVTGFFPPVPARRVFADVRAEVRPTEVLLAASARRRGPPLSAS